MSSATLKISLLEESSRLCTKGCIGAVSSAAGTRWRHLCLSGCCFLLSMVEAVQKSHSKRNSPHPCHHAKLHPKCLWSSSSGYSCHINAHSVGCLDHLVLQESCFPCSLRGAEAVILQGNQFFEAVMIHSKFYNCSCSQSYQIYKCGLNPSPFMEMLDNTKANLRPLRGRCKVH